MDPVNLTASIDIERPSQARIYDYLLGGSLNFEPDRRAARELIAMVPDVPLVAQANRAFLRRATRFLIEAGVRQFLDIGSGIPTRGNVHEIAQQLAPESRVVYVDIDPVAIAHSRAILARDDRTTAILEDARNPARIIDHPDVQALLDFTRPVAVLLVSVLHFVPDSDDPAGILTTLRDAVVPGSYLVLSHVTVDDRLGGAPKVMPNGRRPGLFAKPRAVAEVARFFAGFEPVEPGLVPVEHWRPDPTGKPGNNLALLCMHAGVGRKS
jgi:SAM-dependent methyltransferase